MLSLDQDVTRPRLPNYVTDISTATCVFCPYGADVRPGDRAYAFDEKTSFGRIQRERLVQVTAVKVFRSTGRLLTLDLKIATQAEVQQIAEDSEVPVEALLEHRTGAPTFDESRPPVVVYFKPCKDGDGLAGQFRPQVSRYRSA